MLDITNPTKDLNDGKWHNLTITQDGRSATLQIDSVGDSHIIQGNYKDLDLDEYLYIGGMMPALYRDYRVTETRNYRGCLEDLIFRGRNLIREAAGELRGYTAYGEIVFKCEPQQYRVVSLANPNSGFKVTVRKIPIDNDSFSTSFQFRTYVKDGILVSRAAVKVKLHIRLSGGHLLYDVTAPNGSKTLVKVGANLDDGEWHSVNASLKGRQARILLDGETRTMPLNHSLLMQEFANRSRLKIFAGGHSEVKFPGFVGCLLNLKIDSQRITLKDLKKSKHTHGSVTYSCRLENRCEPNPCLHGGLCSQDWQHYHCSCELTLFEGQRCEIPIYKPTCEHYKDMGLKKSTNCLLDSEGEGRAYTAFCNVTNPSKAYTVITHSKQTKIQVGDAKLDGTLYKHDITYSSSVGMDEIEKLIEKSRHCRQYIRFDCMSSKLLNTPNEPSHAFWLSRDRKKQDYWGGAEPGSRKCACGMTKSCKGTAKFCNCDIRDNIWRVDDGYLTDKGTLPVTGLWFNRKSQKSYFVVGPLECWGYAIKKSTPSPTPRPKPNFIDDRLTRACPTKTPTSRTSATVIRKTIPKASSSTLCPTGDEHSSADCIIPPSSSTNGTMTTPSLTRSSGHVDQTVEGAIMDPNVGNDDQLNGLSTWSLVMISGALVLIVLLSMKFGLPRIIMCIRTHSKRGEYIVPPTGTAGYPARLLPLVTKRSSTRGRQLTQYGGSHRYVEANASGGIKSYWV